MTSRTSREWALIGAVLVGIPMVLCAVVVVVSVKLVGGIVPLSTFVCPQQDSRLAELMMSDDATDGLLTAFPEGPEPTSGCDEDDRTVSAEIARRTVLPREQALRTGVDVLTGNGWRDLGRCYAKRLDDRTVWATLSYQAPSRGDADGDLVVSMVSVRRYAC